MEWPTHIGRILGRNHGRYEHDDNPFLHLLHHPTDDMTEDEQRALDYALAVSRSEMEFENQPELLIERERKKAIIKAQVEEDEQIANALQLSLVMVSSLTNDTEQHDASSKAHSFQPHATASNRICTGCNTEISRSEQVLDCDGTVWHAECLSCHACKQLITDDELYVSENHPYHISCRRKMRYPKCYVCNNTIPRINKVVEYGQHPFWAQKYCPSHEIDGTTKCCSCERLQPKGYEYVLLKDGRSLCQECSSFMVMDTHGCQPLLYEIREFFASLHMKLDQNIPLLLVEREALNNAMEDEKNGHHHLSETRGLCLSEEQTIPIIQRRQRIGSGHPIFDTLTQPFKLVRNSEVTAILILCGLPRLLTGSILAHEMMHAWLRLKGYPNLKPEIEEGICQVLGHMWLKSKIYLGSGAAMAASSSSSPQPRCSNKHKQLSETERKLGECFIRQIELDASSAYGDGFRVAQQAVFQYGLKATLDHIKLTQTFPVSTLIS